MRILTIMGAYYGGCFWDVTHQRPDLQHRQFAMHFAAAVGQALLVLPVCTIAIGAGFMGVLSALQALHCPTRWLNWPIYYGALYGPFASVYFFTKRRALREPVRVLLPT